MTRLSHPLVHSADVEIPAGIETLDSAVVDRSLVAGIRSRLVRVLPLSLPVWVEMAGERLTGRCREVLGPVNETGWVGKFLHSCLST